MQKEKKKKNTKEEGAQLRACVRFEPRARVGCGLTHSQKITQHFLRQFDGQQANCLSRRSKERREKKLFFPASSSQRNATIDRHYVCVCYLCTRARESARAHRNASLAMLHQTTTISRRMSVSALHACSFKQYSQSWYLPHLPSWMRVFLADDWIGKREISKTKNQHRKSDRLCVCVCVCVKHESRCYYGRSAAVCCAGAYPVPATESNPAAVKLGHGRKCKRSDRKHST